MARPRRRNPWTTTGEVLLWVLFTALLFPAAFAGWAVGHYTSLGGEKTKTVTVTAGGTTPTTTTSATSTAATTTSSGTTTAAAGGAVLAAGKSVYNANGCAACHTFAPANSTGTIGPNLDTAPTADAQKDNMPVPAFVKQSIVDPNAYIAPGYPKGVMPTTFGSSLSSAQLNALVAFIVSGQK